MGDERGTVGHRLLCPEIVGRSGEVARLRDRVEALGRGGVVVLVGEAGAGKARLVRPAPAAHEDPPARRGAAGPRPRA